MSEAKTIKVLESLGGAADISQLREQAKKMYPQLQLWRTIHNPLKSLLEKRKVKCKGKFKRGATKKGQVVPKTFWYLPDVDIAKLAPPVKTAGEILKENILRDKMFRDKIDIEEIPMHEDVPVVNPPILEVNKYKLTQKEDGQVQAQKIQNGTLVHELKEAIKEPYLDKLEEVVETVEKKDSHYRGRHDIIFDILGYLDSQEASQSGQFCPGVHVTEIMYKTMLSHWQLKRYIITLMKNKLIDKTDVGYKLTVKGLSYLQTFKSIPINFD